tara:strand:+ start:16627 stop:16788 length:162 start_codon:yes stop_codon:yes gene_type:complete
MAIFDDALRSGAEVHQAVMALIVHFYGLSLAHDAGASISQLPLSCALICERLP